MSAAYRSVRRPIFRSASLRSTMSAALGAWDRVFMLEVMRLTHGSDAKPADAVLQPARETLQTMGRMRRLLDCDTVLLAHLCNTLDMLGDIIARLTLLLQGVGDVVHRLQQPARSLFDSRDRLPGLARQRHTRADLDHSALHVAH